MRRAGPNDLSTHFAALTACTRCPRMHKPVVVGRPVASRIILVGQAPGDKEPKLGRPVAWTAGQTLFTATTEGSEAGSVCAHAGREMTASRAIVRNLQIL